MTILTFNAALLEIRILGRTFFRPIEHIERRFSLMPQYLLQSESDVLCLQEVYRRDHKRRFTEQLKSKYPFVARDPKSFLLGYDSGLMIFSKVPILSQHVKRFSNQPFEEKIFSKKIALATVVELEGKRVGVINCHATSIGFNFKQDDQRIEQIRKQQILEVLEFSASIRESQKCDLMFVTGDYNCGPQISPENYQVFSEFEYVDLFLKDEEELTWDPSKNALIQGATVYRDTPGQRVDLIMTEKSVHKHFRRIETLILYKDDVVKVQDGEFVPLSDHYGVKTSLHSD